MKDHSKGISPAKSIAYRQRFIAHVHTLVWNGFTRLDRSLLPTLHEPEISGLICQMIAEILDDSTSPRWVDEYEVHDDPPVHDKNRTGKHRRRVDIKLASRRSRPRTRFCFEAKCLNNTAGVAEYLGKDGLGQFISGCYAATDDVSGMLAYVQTEGCNAWCVKIEARIDSQRHQIDQFGDWTKVSLIAENPHTFQSIHKRPSKLGNILVLHSFLDCTCPAL